MISRHKEFMEHMYNFRVNAFKYFRIDDKEKSDEKEETKQAARTNLKMMIRLATREVESENPTNREFRHWLIWNEVWIESIGKEIDFAMCADFRRTLPKCSARQIFSQSSTMAYNSEDFQILLNEFERTLSILQRKKSESSLCQHATKQFCSLLTKMSENLYEQTKCNVVKWYKSMFDILTKHKNNQLKIQLTKAYRLCRRTFEINLHDDIGDSDDDDINDESLRREQQNAIERELKRMGNKKLTDLWNDMENKTGPVYETCENRLKTLKKEYLSLPVLFSENSLKLDGIRYIKNNWGNIR